MSITLRIVLMVALFATGFAAGFPTGRSIGFATGSEWALVQAQLLARESGLDMPVSFDGDQFRVVMRQPRHFYRNARTLASRREDEMARVKDGAKCLGVSTHLVRNTASNE